MAFSVILNGLFSISGEQWCTVVLFHLVLLGSSWHEVHRRAPWVIKFGFPDVYPRNFGWILDKIVRLSICPYYSRPSRKWPPKMQRLGGHLRGVVAYESQTARSKFLSSPRMEWYVYLLKVYFPLTITGSFYDKIIGHCMWQFIYGSPIN